LPDSVSQRPDEVGCASPRGVLRDGSRNVCALDAMDKPSRQMRTTDAHGLRWSSSLLLGLVGGVVGALAMNVFARAASAATHGHEASGAALGSDRVGRGVQPPQSDGPADDDAAVRVGTLAYRVTMSAEPTRVARPWLGTVAHYAFGGTLGAGYALLARRLRMVRVGYGTAYGTAVWIVADELIMPALRLSRGPRQLSLGVHVYALSGHWIYGAMLEFVVRRATRRWASVRQTT
jgi:putative membrane protein